jgi:hypothetical protein
MESSKKSNSKLGLVALALMLVVPIGIAGGALAAVMAAITVGCIERASKVNGFMGATFWGLLTLIFALITIGQISLENDKRNGTYEYRTWEGVRADCREELSTLNIDPAQFDSFVEACVNYVVSEQSK